MLKKLKKLILLTALAFNPLSAMADFDIAGKGTLSYPTGMTKAFEFGFAFKQDNNDYFFQVGKQKMRTSDVPSKYTIWLTLDDKGRVSVREFGRGYFQGFEWQLDKHKLSLAKKVFKKDPVKSDYVLTINNKEYYFTKQTGQIDINFTSKGIRSFSPSGFTTDRRLSKPEKK